MQSPNYLLSVLKELTVLYVEDDLSTQNIIAEILREFFRSVKVASNGLDALTIFENEHINLIITDIEMPELDGLKFIQSVRENDICTPVIMLTAYTDSKYLLQSINLKIDSYIVKPISYTKIKDALFKLAKAIYKTNNIYINICNGLAYDRLNSSLILNNSRISLQKKEKMLIELLIENKGDLVLYSQIERRLWSDFNDVMTSSALRTVVKKLRQKVDLDFIENVSGSGYRLLF